MHIAARVENRPGSHYIVVESNGQPRAVDIPPKAEGLGSSVNGGELLFLALATCYCNDLYREASKRGIAVERVQVEVSGEFGAEGEPARNIQYRASVDAKASEAEIMALMRYTDTVAEIQNTLRATPGVVLAECVARSI